MKKTILGYSIKEVDENIGYLESQNIKLERQVKQLASELEKTKKELEKASLNLGSSSEIAEVAEKDRLISQLKQKLSDSQRENNELVSKAETLTNRIGEMSAADKSEKSVTIDDVGNICKEAYADMHVTKQKTKEHLEKFLDRFWLEWNTYEHKFFELTEQVSSRQKENINSFISYADYVLQAYGDMENSNIELDSRVAEIIGNKAKIEESLNTIIAELDKDFDDEDNFSALSSDVVEKEDETEEDSEKRNSILDAIRIMRKKQLTQEPEKVESNIQSEVLLGDSTIPEPESTDEKKDEMCISQTVNIRNII